MQIEGAGYKTGKAVWVYIMDDPYCQGLLVYLINIYWVPTMS